MSSDYTPDVPPVAEDTGPNPSEAVQCKPLEVVVGDRGIERAIKHLKRKMASEGILRELKRRRHYMKPSIKKRKKQSEAARRRRKRLRTDIPV
jgi:small subunit ribosomal protein S21